MAHDANAICMRMSDATKELTKASRVSGVKIFYTPRKPQVASRANRVGRTQVYRIVVESLTHFSQSRAQY